MQPNKLKNIKFYNDEKIKIVSIIKFNNSIIEEYKKHTDDFIWDRVLKIKALIQENIELYKQLKKKKAVCIKPIKTVREKPLLFQLNLWSKKLYTFNECIDIGFERCKNI